MLFSCGSDAGADGNAPMPVDSLAALIDLAETAIPGDTAAVAATPKAAAQKEERKQIIQEQAEKSEACKLGCPGLLERYREAVELAVAKKDESKLKFFVEHANDPCLQACRQKGEGKAAFKVLDERLNKASEAEIF